MAFSFFFYDLETSGVSARKSRVMQFAGQRTDENLKPVGEPYNFLIKITEDVLPEPDAILITGITPQKTLQDGISEAEFCAIFDQEISTPNTCFLGFNSVRFDDEFMRFLFYRNFYDPYAWQWRDGRSRWDMLDVARMTRALRPDGIKWPVDSEGVPTNRLELLAKANDLLHESAHDALSDVKATIGVAEMIKSHQPKLFEYLKSVRGKQEAKKLIATGQPFVYSSGKYSSRYEKTTVAHNLGPHPDRQGVLVYDLRHDPSPFIKMTPAELAEIWKYNKDKEAVRLPVKSLQFNRCPAISPLGVLDDSSWQRIGLDLATVKKHRATVAGEKTFYPKLVEALEILNKARGDQAALFSDLQTVDEQLYDGFIGDPDRRVSEQITRAKPDNLSTYASNLEDPRLKGLLPLYKARNFQKYLNDEERQAWEEYRTKALTGGGGNSSLARFSRRLDDLAQKTSDKNKQYLLEELKLYAESIAPEI